MRDPRLRVRTAVSNLRTIGILFLMFTAGMLYFARRFGLSLPGFASLALVLAIPAAGYIAASVKVPRQSVAAGRWAMWLSFLQPVLAVAAIVIGTQFRHLFLRSYDGGMVMVPGTLVMFFIPALVAQGVQLWLALRDINLMPDSQHAFEPIPMAKVAPKDE